MLKIDYWNSFAKFSNTQNQNQKILKVDYRNSFPKFSDTQNKN